MYLNNKGGILMKLRKLFFIIIGCMFIGLFCQPLKSYASERLSFDKEVYVIDDFSEVIVEMDIPEGYTKSDIVFKSDDENIAKVWYFNPFDKDDDKYDEWEEKTNIAIQAEEKLGETKIQATIEGTEFSASTHVKVENPIKINCEKNESDIVLKIESKCGLYFIDTQYQAIDIGVKPIGGEFSWERLGFDKFGGALNKNYFYTLKGDTEYEVIVCWTFWDEGDVVEPGKGPEWISNRTFINKIEDEEEILWDISTNKESIKLKVGESTKIDIIAELKEGMSSIHLVEMRKDNWDVEWKINDETIAKCIPEKGIENNIHGITQIAGKASINALKAGSTKLSVKVKVSNNKTEEIEIPITIVDSDEKKDDEEISNGAKIKILAENDKKVLDIGETLKLSVEFLEMSDQNVNWESIDSSIATVDKAGKVTALKEGTVKIKVYTEDKNFSDEYEITVKKTTSNEKLPQTGEHSLLVCGIAGIILIIGVISIIKYKKFKKI